MEPRGFVRRNYPISSDEAFLSVRCQFGVSTDTIFEKRYPLDLNLNSNLNRRKHILSYEITKKVLEKKIIYMLAPVKQVSSDEMVRTQSAKTGNRTLVQSFCYANLYRIA